MLCMNRREVLKKPGLNAAEKKTLMAMVVRKESEESLRTAGAWPALHPTTGAATTNSGGGGGCGPNLQFGGHTCILFDFENPSIEA